MTPTVGDFAVVRTNGLAPSLIRWATESPVNHAFVYVGDGQIVEAEPDGARLASVDSYPADAVTWSTGRVLLDDFERRRIATSARSMIGRPYGWLDIVAITFAQRRLGALVNSRTWWVRRLQSRTRLICSQLVDVAYGDAGVHLFDDGRVAGLVSPGDLLRVIDTNGKSIRRDILIPGRLT